MILIDAVLFLGFIETVILFFYAVRWYIFTFIVLKSKVKSNPIKHINNKSSGFVTVLLPIYNEPNVVDRLLSACTSFNSPPYEVIVINDSDDGVTTRKLEAWRDHPRVKIIHRSTRKGWKAGAMNVALDNVDPKSTHVLIFDADFVPPSDLASRFLERFNDDTVSVVQGCQRHDLNAEENWVTKSVRAWFSLYNVIELNGQNQLGLFVPLTGSVFMARTEVLKKLKFEEVTDEDWNLTMRLYEHGYKIDFDPTLVASGECPNTLRRLFKQHARWAEGHSRTFTDHFFKIWRSKFLTLKEKIDFVFMGCTFLNCILVVVLTAATLITMLFPQQYLPNPLVQTSMILLLASIPSAIVASITALLKEGARKDLKKIPYAWLASYVVTPVVAYAALKGLITKKGFFHRTYKTGKIVKS
ncbi:glycosyltransferase family 2 protein [Candidatus Bathyarchaeota archaeon]|nr:glycosyltransferase family 2 protein [Candidatus Bathyarchaeota archaeon]